MSDEKREEESDRGFKVQDRRRFSATGDPRADAGPNDAADEPSTAGPEARPASEERSNPTHDEREGAPLPDINFTTFTISLSTQALVHLGEVEDPEGRAGGVDLDAAKQLIDILGMLEEKTRGNLAADEAQLVETILYDLRLRYVEKAKHRPGA